MTHEHNCAGKVYGPGVFIPYECRHAGTVEEQGKWWCKQHAPSLVKARRKAREEAWQDKYAAERAEAQKRAEARLFEQTCAAVVRLTAVNLGMEPATLLDRLREGGLRKLLEASV